MRFQALKMSIAALLFQALLVGPALAQDFDSLVSSAAAANQTWLQQIDLALGAQDEATFRAQAATAAATGDQVQSLLTQALSLAPDDASRSRVQGLLNHVTAAVQAGHSALQTADFAQAQSQVNAMRGEANEALSELAPFAAQIPPVVQAPEALPSAGDQPVNPLFGGFAAAVLALGGALAVLAGLRLRRKYV